MKIITIVTAILIAGANFISAADWWENVLVKGDLRYRHEMIKAGENETRNRHRIRARVGITGKVNDFANVGIQFATGSDDPVSTNQSLDNGFSTKNLMLDLAYLTMKPTFAEGLTVTAGKFKNPYFKPGKSELLWDSDLNPEGGVLNYTNQLDNFDITVIGAGLWIEERSSGKDSWLGAGQAVLGFNFNEKKSGVKFGAGMFNYVNVKMYRPFYDDDAFGNSIDDYGTYMFDYELTETYFEINHKFKDYSVTVMGDFVTNNAVDNLNSGWLVGIKAGKTKKPGTWDLRYNYREVERDAVIGTYTDSDFRGGGTDANGHEVGGGYQIADNMKFNVSYFINKIGLEENEQTDFNRLQVDLQLKF